MNEAVDPGPIWDDQDGPIESISAEAIFEPVWRPKCITCITMFFDWQQKVLDEDPLAGPEPVVEDAITMAPAWQEKMIGNRMTGMQLMYACIALPTCMGHLGKVELTDEQKAVKGGVILPGAGG
jgi:hypothetical protein